MTPIDTFGKPILPGGLIVFNSKAGTGSQYGVRRLGIVQSTTESTLRVKVVCLDRFDEIWLKVPAGSACVISVRALNRSYSEMAGFGHVLVVPPEAEEMLGCKTEADALRAM